MNKNMKREKKSEYNLIPIGYCVKNDIVWFLQYQGTSLIKMDLKTFKIINIYLLPNLEQIHEGVYASKIFACGDYLCIFNYGSQYIYRFNLLSESFDYILLGEDEQYKSRAAYMEGEEIWLLPYGTNYVLKYNYVTLDIEKVDLQGARMYINAPYVHINDELICVDAMSNSLYRIELQTGSCQKIDLEHEDMRYWGIVEVGDHYVVPCKTERKLLLLDRNLNILDQIEVQIEGYEALDGYAISDIHVYENIIYIFPLFSNMIIKINIIEKSVRQAFGNVKFVEVNGGEFIDTFRLKQFVYAYYPVKKKWYVFDLKNDSFELFDTEKIEDVTMEKTLRMLFWREEKQQIEEDYFNNTLRNFIYSLENIQ